jgi:hypothetical protein
MKRFAPDDHARFWSPWRLARWGAAAALLLLPWVAMQFTDEVKWDGADFAFAGALVAGAGLAYELAVRPGASRAWRAGMAVALATAVMMVWANAAVGLIGSEDNPANRMYYAVLAVAGVGALLARLRPKAMSLALAATALAQVVVDLVSVYAGMGFAGPVTLFFAGLWLTSAWLFRSAARREHGGVGES